MSEIRFSAASRVGILLLGLLITGSAAGGATGGVGILLASEDGWVTILQVTENGPAARAGLQPSDKIARIDGKPMRGVALQDAVGRLTGPEGEKVTLTIRRQVGSQTDEFDVTLTREVIRPRMLDAAAALDVDTEAPWFLNMRNCPKAWEITKGKGSTVAVTDAGFHLQHPEQALSRIWYQPTPAWRARRSACRSA